MKQAFYEIGNRGMEVTATSPGLDESARAFVKKAGGYQPNPKEGPPAGAVRFGLFLAANGRRVLLQAVPVSGSRGGFSFTHALVIEPDEDAHAADLLCGWRDPFWRMAAGSDTSLEPVPTRPMPWAGQRQDFDARLIRWAADPARRHVVAAVLDSVLLHRSRSSTVYLPGEPEDTFWAAYAAARLLPKAAARRLSFSTHEAPMTARDLRVVGGKPLSSGDRPPMRCTTPPNVWIDLTVPSDTEHVAKTYGYAEAAFATWLEAPHLFDRLLADAAEVDDPALLERWLRIRCRPQSITPSELEHLSSEPRWQKEIAGSATSLRRLLTANLARARPTINMAAQEVQTELADELAKEVAAAVSEMRPLAVRELFNQAAACPDVVCRRLARAVADAPAAADPETWLLLAEWLGIEHCESQALRDTAALTGALPRAGANVASVIAEWVLRPARQLTPAGYRALVANKQLWAVVSDRLMKPDLAPASLFGALCEHAKDELAVAGDIDSLLTSLLAAHPDQAEDLTAAVERTQIVASADLLLAASASGKMLSLPLQKRLALAVLNDGDGCAIADGDLREAVLAFQAQENGLEGTTKARWNALRAISDLESASPDVVADLLTRLSSWNADRVFGAQGAMNESPLAKRVLARVCAAAAEPSVDGLRGWYQSLYAVWERSGRRFWLDFLSALKYWSPAVARQCAIVQVVWLANETAELQADTEAWLAGLSGDDCTTVGTAIWEQLQNTYVNRLVLTGPLKQKPRGSKLDWLLRGRRDVG